MSMSRTVSNIESGRSFSVPNSTTPDNIVVWRNATGTSLGESAVSLASQNMTNLNSITLNEQISNPGGNDTLWINSATSQVMLGDQNLHEIGGDVVGPAGSTNTAVVRFDGTMGATVQDSTVTIDDSGNTAGVKSVSFTSSTSNPGASGTLWYNASTGVLNASADEVVISGANTSVNNEMARLSGTNGNTLKGAPWVLTDDGYVYNKSGESLIVMNPGPVMNTAVGWVSGPQDPADFGNVSYSTFVGSSAGGGLKSGGNITAVGYGALSQAIGTGTNVSGSVALGDLALQSLVNGVSNVAVGSQASSTLSTGTNNVYISNVGQASENNTMRFGNAEHVACWLSGVVDAPTGDSLVTNTVVMTGGGQLSSVPRLPLISYYHHEFVPFIDVVTGGVQFNLPAEIRFARVGNIVTMALQNGMSGALTTSSIIRSNFTMPAEYIPSDWYRSHILAYSGTTYDCSVFIDGSGVIELGVTSYGASSITTTNFTTGTVVIAAFTASWCGNFI